MTTTTAPASQAIETRPRWHAAVVLIGITSLAIAFQIAMEVLVIVLQPERGGDFVQNIISVTVASLVGLALTGGLVALGQRFGKVRTPMAWVLAILGLLACAVFYFLALPTTLAAGAYVLARTGAGSLRAARVVAIVGIIASFAVSAAMMITYL